MKKLNYIITGITFLVIIIIFILINFEKRANYTGSLSIEIPKKTSLNGIIELFNVRGILEPGWLYKSTARVYSLLNKKTVQAGYYTFKKGLSNYELLKELFSPSNLNIVKVTIPEGLTYKEIAGILAVKSGIDKAEFLRLARSDSLLMSRGINAESVEGYLMPETYFFYWKQTATEVIDRLLDEQDKIWNRRERTLASLNNLPLTKNLVNLSDKAKAIGMSRHEILTLASILEAETPNADERARISGVYHNRLEKGWNLQADPTVQYGLGTKSKLSKTDLMAINEYNTYLKSGLPPGPINNPGISSIEAAINPEKHEFMYFVSIGDGSGRHNFARTLSQHNANKREFRKKSK